MKIGILALQGNFCQHKIVLDSLGIQNTYIYYPRQIDKCDALIIPGGESTTISKQIDNNQFRQTLYKFSITKPIFGTCAGMIMLSSTKPTDNMNPLNIMDFRIERNAWGRQVHSFATKINLNFDKKRNFHAVFIRAPKIKMIGNGVKVLATYKDEPILLTNGMHIVSSFHPEIGHDYRVHKFFLDQIK